MALTVCSGCGKSTGLNGSCPSCGKTKEQQNQIVDEVLAIHTKQFIVGHLRLAEFLTVLSVFKRKYHQKLNFENSEPENTNQMKVTISGTNLGLIAFADTIKKILS